MCLSVSVFILGGLLIFLHLYAVFHKNLGNLWLLFLQIGFFLYLFFSGGANNKYISLADIVF